MTVKSWLVKFVEAISPIETESDTNCREAAGAILSELEKARPSAKVLDTNLIVLRRNSKRLSDWLRKEELDMVQFYIRDANKLSAEEEKAMQTRFEFDSEGG